MPKLMTLCLCLCPCPCLSLCLCLCLPALVSLPVNKPCAAVTGVAS